MALSCSLCYLCISSWFPAKKIIFVCFVKWYFDIKMSCSLCNLCISSWFPAKKLIFAWFARWYFDIAMSSWFTQNILMYVNILGRPCCKNCKICGETTEGCSRHNAAAIVARRLRTSAKVQLKLFCTNYDLPKVFCFYEPIVASKLWVPFSGAICFSQSFCFAPTIT